MKAIKKFMASGVIMALVLGAVFAFTGCGLRGKDYAYSATTITVITKTEKDAEGKVTITETQDLTLEEYYMYTVKGVALDKLAETELTEAETKAFEDAIDGIISALNHQYTYMKKSSLKFGSKEVEVSITETNEWTGIKEVMTSKMEYEKTDDGYVVYESLGERNDYYSSYTERQVTVDANGNLVYRIATDFNSDAAVSAEKAVYSINIVYAAVK